MFRGWKEVFGFTFSQNVKTKGFKSAFIIITVALFLIGFGINVIIGYFMNKEHTKKEFVNEIEELVIVNETEMPSSVIEGYAEYSKYAQNMIITVSDKNKDDAVDFSNEENEKKVVLNVYFSDNYFEEDEEKDEKSAFVVDVYSVEAISNKNAKKIAKEFTEYFEENRYVLTDIPGDVAVLLDMNITGEVVDVQDKDENIGAMLIKVFVPMITVLVIYFIILLYGQTIGKALVVEKDSKLMETLLISVKPYAVVFGKVLAMYLVALMQVFTWVIAAVAGFMAGDMFAENTYEKYNNPIKEVMSFLAKDTKSAFSIEAVIIGILAFAVGILLYFTFAALVASNATKTEELTNGMAIFQMIVVIGFLAAYMIPLMQAESPILKYLRYIPITSPYMVTSDVIIGNMGILDGIISLIIMILCTVITILLTGKIYKKKVF